MKVSALLKKSLPHTNLVVNWLDEYDCFVYVWTNIAGDPSDVSDKKFFDISKNADIVTVDPDFFLDDETGEVIPYLCISAVLKKE